MCVERNGFYKKPYCTIIKFLSTKKGKCVSTFPRRLLVNRVPARTVFYSRIFMLSFALHAQSWNTLFGSFCYSFTILTCTLSCVSAIEFSYGCIFDVMPLRSNTLLYSLNMVTRTISCFKKYHRIWYCHVEFLC